MVSLQRLAGRRPDLRAHLRNECYPGELGRSPAEVAARGLADAARAQQLLEVPQQGRRRLDPELVVEAQHLDPAASHQPQVYLSRTGVRPQDFLEALDYWRDAPPFQHRHHERASLA